LNNKIISEILMKYNMEGRAIAKTEVMRDQNRSYLQCMNKLMQKYIKHQITPTYPASKSAEA
jgi:hypothetical protein